MPEWKLQIIKLSTKNGFRFRNIGNLISTISGLAVSLADKEFPPIFFMDGSNLHKITIPPSRTPFNSGLILVILLISRLVYGIML